jgi:hypothetical protein
LDSHETCWKVSAAWEPSIFIADPWGSFLGPSGPASTQNVVPPAHETSVGGAVSDGELLVIDNPYASSLTVTVVGSVMVLPEPVAEMVKVLTTAPDADLALSKKLTVMVFLMVPEGGVQSTL